MQSVLRISGRRLTRSAFSSRNIATKLQTDRRLSSIAATAIGSSILSPKLSKARVVPDLPRTLSSAARAYSTPAAATSPSSASELVDSIDLGDMIPMDRIRNVGIIAHVDHGKTTLVDCLLKQSGALSGSTAMQETRVMDSNVIEKERGITILSKVTSLVYKDHRINIIDTPGHADFGGEVERILSMVDSVVLVVDATEGAMAQTKFVLTKALSRGLNPLVVLNKVDRPTSRPDEVDSELLELFMALGASDEQTAYEI
ncbi:hypothetical protein GGF37_004236, partial [Kickxella alabastrina]